MEGARANRLARETSPYLLQHAQNPVDWYPWGEEAFERARREDKPILLSIGYSACHWCHVMERESFSDPETARIINENFVAIKVDREERPDVDMVYMRAVQVLTGRGGWPLTVFLTPEGAPFLGGTYFPPEDRHGLPSFKRVLLAVATLWRERRREVLGQAASLMEGLARAASPSPRQEPFTEEILYRAVSGILSGYDRQFGGFGGPPKFPQAPLLEFLLRGAARAGFLPEGSVKAEVRQALARTVSAMALGGIYDQLAGGFHRYSVDRSWTVPHFEKMLYDNALLARVYLRAGLELGDGLFRRIATETLEYLLREMRLPEGGFCSSQDAEAAGEEGTPYTWTYDEVASLAPEALEYYRVTPEGNFWGKNVLLAAAPEPPAGARARLLEVRLLKPQPARDDKVLSSWNGLAVGALAEAGAVLGRPDFLAAAKAAASFVLEAARRPDGELLHVWRAGKARVRGLLEDYAFLAEGLLSLWEATFDETWLQAAEELARLALEIFRDPSDGGFFASPADGDEPGPPVREKEVMEGPTPAPGAVLCLVLQRLGVLLGSDELARAGKEGLAVAGTFVERVPQGTSSWLSALSFAILGGREVAILGDLDSPRGVSLVSALRSMYIPNLVLAGSARGSGTWAWERSPLLKGREAPPGEALAYVCENYVCQAPTSDPEELRRSLVGGGG